MTSRPYTTSRRSRYLRAALFAALLPLVACALGSAPGSSARVAAAGPQQNTGVRWGFYITYNPNSWASLQANVASLNYVSPWFYNLNSQGQVTGTPQPQVNTLLSNNGVNNLPMLKNTPQYNDFTAILLDDGAQNSIVNQIETLVTFNNYAGITIDFEGLNATDKPLLTTFMSRLYARLHPQGKLVAMAVAPKVQDVSTGWAAPYDYSALANATDYLLIMAYDYHWATGDPGPIAPINKLRDTAAYTLAHVPASQVIWGIGVYGYDWATDSAGHSLGHAEYRTFGEADMIASGPTARSGYDDASQAPWVRYTRDAQTREVWYENGRSFQAKLDLIAQNGMAGFAIWRLGQEDPRVWQAIAGGSQPPPQYPSPTPTRATAPTRTPTARPTQTPRPMATATATPTATPKPKPAACNPVASFASTPGKIYFQQTRHSLGGAFLQYWQAHGGLPVFGYPLTEEFTETSPTDGKSYRVQYFERNRFEYHPENQPPNDVQLGLLGVQAVGGRSFPVAGSTLGGADMVFFPQVQHTLAGPFFFYWKAHGGLAMFGYPISEPVLEQSPTNGKTYTVQYLERARFELHTEYAGTDAEVLLGLLGLNVLPCK